MEVRQEAAVGARYALAPVRLGNFEQGIRELRATTKLYRPAMSIQERPSVSRI